MANIMVVKKLLDGPRSAVFHVYLKSDGASGEVVNQVIIDPHTDLNPVQERGMRLSLRQTWHSLYGFSATLTFDSVDPMGALVINDTAESFDFSDFGGIQDTSGVDATGKLLITTANFGNSIMNQGTIIVKVNKSPKPFTNA